jgi:membrane protease YdiL (CAAX protease family)
MKKRATFVGLIIAWGGPAFLASPANHTTALVGLLAMWALLAIIIAIVLFWERQPLSSMGLRPLDWRSFAWGFALAAFTMWLLLPLLSWGLRSAGLAGFESGMANAMALPAWIRLIATVTAGIVEDGLFLGFAFTRLERLTGNAWLAGAISVLVSAGLHSPNWGIGPVLAFVVAETISTAFFVWRRDLPANMTAHVIVDTMGLVIIPLLPSIL